MSRPSRMPLEQLQPFLVDVPNPRNLPPERVPAAPTQIAWPALFGNGQPVEVEVGFGKGSFLVASAQARSDTNFLGIEIERKYVLMTAGRLARHGLANAKVACTDARWFLEHYVADGSVRALHVYFPDPWWKQRHKKRLLFTSAFAVQVARVLERGGMLHFASDVHEYFERTRHLLRELGDLYEVKGEASDQSIPTNFERKYRDEGRPIYRAHFMAIRTFFQRSVHPRGE